MPGEADKPSFIFTTFIMFHEMKSVE
jgi:hypothetical protein